MKAVDNAQPWTKRKGGRLWLRDVEPEVVKITRAMEDAGTPTEIKERVLSLVTALVKTIETDRLAHSFSSYLHGGMLDYDERMDTVVGLQSMVVDLTQELRLCRGEH